MANTIVLHKMPTPLELYPRLTTTFFKNGKGDLPDRTIVLENQSITPQQVKKYNKVCGFEHALIIPATFLHTYAFSLHTYLLTQIDSPFPVLGMIHLANTIRQHRPLYVGEHFTMQCSFGNLIAHNKGQGFEIFSKVFVNQKLIWEDASIYFHKGKEGIGTVLEMDIEELNDNCIKKTWNLSSNLGLEYAQASGDFNPIHLHPFSAKLFGFQRHIIHGMWTKAKVLAELEKQVSDSFEMSVAFKTPIFLPASVIFRYEKDKKGFNFDVVDKHQEKPHLRGYLYNC